VFEEQWAHYAHHSKIPQTGTISNTHETGQVGWAVAPDFACNPVALTPDWARGLS